MTDVRRLVQLVADTLGPDASLAEVESVSRTLLRQLVPKDEPRIERSSQRQSSAEIPDEGITVHAATLDVSLLDCASRLPQTVGSHIYDKIRRVAGHHVRTAEHISTELGIRVAETRVATTPVGSLCYGFSASDLVRVAQTLNLAADDIDVDFLTGFSARATGGLDDGVRSFLESIPSVLGSTDRLLASVELASLGRMCRVDAARAVAAAMTQMSGHADGSPGAARLSLLANADRCNAYDRGFHIDGRSPGLSIHILVSAHRPLVKAVASCGVDADMETVRSAMRSTAVSLTRSAEAVAVRWADRLKEQSGFPVHIGTASISLTPAHETGDEFASMTDAMGIDAGSAGTAAVLTMVHRWAESGSAAASDRACTPAGGYLSLGHRQISDSSLHEARVSPVAAVPGDTSTDTLSAIILDSTAAGTDTDRGIVVRMVAPDGKRAGDTVDLGPRFGQVIVSSVHPAKAERLLNRGR